MYRSSISLSTSSFHVFLGLLLCLSSSASKVTHFFTHSSLSFLKTCPSRSISLEHFHYVFYSMPIPQLSDVLVKRYVDFCILPSQYCSFSFAITVAKCQCDMLNGFSRESWWNWWWWWWWWWCCRQLDSNELTCISETALRNLHDMEILWVTLLPV